ncbi:hypothetical protein M406DRAFT_356899 [Cryphonectria parasitica EP155]|uniref:Uncharacterized protein n=1 Tax=Cryphonectria parasitica (strain ATCC 38755 / EP155) TaxID=660469 RepID=A0A9P5CM87_CRYP1|nr:uncharacterized protein M406DRAFT_356899 [Cryphonectria parasitica EP155]KAF3763007.1 hypothetical protein M406DRAFT_356899 [Cryphonectria parasitica EP155]
MKKHACAVGYPAHGMVVQDLEGKIEWELASKVKRETRILQTLAKLKLQTGSGRGKASVTVQQLVSAMHGEKLDAQVRSMAVEPFTEEVLKKLSQDGKVAFEVRGGQKRWYGIQPIEIRV